MLLIVLLMIGGCNYEKEPLGRSSEPLILYSEMSRGFTEDIVDAYNAKQRGTVTLKAVYQLQSDDLMPDIILAERSSLVDMKNRRKLQPVTFSAGDLIHADCKDEDAFWYGFFFDPVVFLVNQQFSRSVGQKNIVSWKDLEEAEGIRVAMENLSDNDSTRNFLGSFASQIGEAEAFNYFSNLNKLIAQYAKFPFTPVRMTALGDADVAITRLSYVFKYLENDFPAYIVHPREGAPVNLYGAGVCRGTKKTVQAEDFLTWLIAGDEVQRIAQKNFTGYMFLFPQGIEGSPADIKKIWINKKFQGDPEREALAARWVETIRFSK